MRMFRGAWLVVVALAVTSMAAMASACASSTATSASNVAASSASADSATAELGTPPADASTSEAASAGDAERAGSASSGDGSRADFSESAGTPASGAAQPAPSVSLVDLSPRSIQLELIAELDDVLAMAVHPGSDTVYLGRQTGQIHRVDRSPDGEWAVQDRPMFSLADRTVANKERGFLSFTYSPAGDHLYAVWTDRDTNANLLTEFAVDAIGAIQAESERVVMEIDQPYRNHNGGHVAFGPDGYLYYGLGDGGSGGDPLDHGQDPTTLLGAILRIDPFARDAGHYGIPPTNPYADGGGGAPEIFLTGVRNPWRFSFDPVSGDLWVADVGQDEYEEINVLRAGAGGGLGVNLGWNIREGAAPFSGEQTAGLTDPLFAYPHEERACSVTGGFVYRGTQLPQIEGAYVYGDWCGGGVWALSQDGRINAAIDVSVGPRKLASFGETPDGELWILASGRVFELVAQR